MEKILDLVLTHHWFEEIQSSFKKEEYRDVFKWCHRLLDIKDGDEFRRARKEDFANFIQISSDPNTEFAVQLSSQIRKGNIRFRNYDVVRFRRGYTSTSIDFKIESIELGTGKEEWGAPAESVFIIRLGEKIR